MTGRPIAFCLAVLAAATGGLAGEGVKLRPLAPLYVDAKGAGFATPAGVACDGKSSLVVADSGNGRLVQFTLGPEGPSGGTEYRLAEIPFPVRAAFAADGTLLVLDGKLRKIARVSASGEFGGYVDFAAAGAGAGVVPRALAVDRGGSIYVLDIAGARVVVLDPAGKMTRTLPYPDAAGFLSDVAVDAHGTVYLLDSVGKQLFAAAAGAKAAVALGASFKDVADFPTALVAEEGGRLFVADQNGCDLLVFGADGSLRGQQSGMGWKDGALRYPSSLCVDGRGLLFVADRGNSRVQPFAIGQ